jgi:hypothetical protein
MNRDLRGRLGRVLGLLGWYFSSGLGRSLLSSGWLLGRYLGSWLLSWNFGSWLGGVLVGGSWLFRGDLGSRLFSWYFSGRLGRVLLSSGRLGNLGGGSSGRGSWGGSGRSRSGGRSGITTRVDCWTGSDKGGLILTTVERPGLEVGVEVVSGWEGGSQCRDG